MPIVQDIDDDKLEKLAQEKGVPALVKAPSISTEAEAASNPVGQGARPKPASRKPKEEAAPSEPTPRSRMKSINLELPDYVWTDLKIRKRCPDHT